MATPLQRAVPAAMPEPGSAWLIIMLWTAQKVERLRASLHFIGAPDQAVPQGASGGCTSGRGAAHHTVFVDGEEEARQFRPEEFFDTPAELLGRAFNRPRTAQLAAPGAVRGVAPGAGGAKRAERCAPSRATLQPGLATHPSSKAQHALPRRHGALRRWPGLVQTWRSRSA